MVSFADTPWPDTSDVEVIKQIRLGKRMAPPHNCPVVLYEIMTECWAPRPSRRLVPKILLQRITAITPSALEAVCQLESDSRFNVNPLYFSPSTEQEEESRI